MCFFIRGAYVYMFVACKYMFMFVSDSVLFTCKSHQAVTQRICIASKSKRTRQDILLSTNLCCMKGADAIEAFTLKIIPCDMFA